MKRILKYAGILFLAFCVVYTMCGICGLEITVKNAQAEVAGMDSYDLKYDYDFKRAVKAVVEDNCEVDGTSISCY